MLNFRPRTDDDDDEEEEEEEEEGRGVMDVNAILSENNPFTASFTYQ